MRRSGGAPTGDHVVVRLGEDGGRTALLVNGVVQSISPADGVAQPGYWAAMLPPIRPRRALILGLGGGTLARLLADRWGPGLRIVGVDDDLAVLETARAAGWLALAGGSCPAAPGLDVVLADAFAYVRSCQERFDYIGVDLYRGEQIVGRALARPFLRRLRELLDPPGWLAVNIFRDRRRQQRVERIGRVFAVKRQVAVGGNVVVHARPR